MTNIFKTHLLKFEEMKPLDEHKKNQAKIITWVSGISLVYTENKSVSWDLSMGFGFSGAALLIETPFLG